jgi:hypothetical protein
LFSGRRDDFPDRLKRGGSRLVEVRVTKVGAGFSSNAEGRVDLDAHSEKRKRQPATKVTELLLTLGCG